MTTRLQSHKDLPRGLKSPVQPKKSPEKTVATGKRIPSCPTYLGKHGKELFAWAVEKLHEMKLEDAADFRAIEALASAYEDYREAREVVDEDGMTYKTFTQAGELKFCKRPEVDIMADAWKRMTSLLPHLCLTTTSRSKGKPGKGGEEDHDPFAAFIGGKS
jgi:P27 family predicted phage terminase small subunit